MVTKPTHRKVRDVWGTRIVLGDPAGTADLDFTGQRQDMVAGLYDFQYREQNPNQGRWLSPDPAGLGAVNPSDPQSWNRYSYVQNSALSKTDPLGLMASASGDGEFRIEGVDIPPYIFAELAGGVAGALVNCYGWCDQINKTVPAPNNSDNTGATYTLEVGAAGAVWINNVSGLEMSLADDEELGLRLPGLGSGGQFVPSTSTTNGRCLSNVNSFVHAHVADATTLANSLGNGATPAEVLATAGNETGYGGGFANIGNYFGIHGAGPSGTYWTTGNPSAPVAKFPVSNGFLLSGQVFVGLIQPYLTPQTAANPLQFFTLLNQHGYATGNSGYPAAMVKKGAKRGPYTLVSACM